VPSRSFSPPPGAAADSGPTTVGPGRDGIRGSRLPALDRELVDGADGAGDPGVQEGEVDAAEALPRGRRGAFDVLLRGDVADRGDRLVTELPGDGLEPFRVDVEQDQPRALGRQSPRRRGAHPVGRPGDQGRLALDSSQHVRFSFRP
jgi:hypothetical protein